MSMQHIDFEDAFQLYFEEKEDIEDIYNFI